MPSQKCKRAKGVQMTEQQPKISQIIEVVYHQYIYQVYTLESDQQVLDRPGRILLVLVANQYMYILSVSIAPFFVGVEF
jgi:hypothetical protein